MTQNETEASARDIPVSAGNSEPAPIFARRRLAERDSGDAGQTDSVPVKPASLPEKPAVTGGNVSQFPIKSVTEPRKSVNVTDKSVSHDPKTDLTDLSVFPADKSVNKIVDMDRFRSRRLTSQSAADFDKKQWKKSRIKQGWLIRRLTGYSIVEGEYGVQYLGVVSRKPDRMSADSLEYPLAGFFIWSVMAERSLLVEERGQNAKTKLG